MMTLAVLTGALAALFLLTAWLTRWESAKGAHPFIIYIGAYYFLFFGILSWIAAKFEEYLPYEGSVAPSAAVYIFAFLTLQIAGYVFGLWLIVGRPETATVQREEPLMLAAWASVALALMFYFVPEMLTLPSLPQLRHPSWYFGFAVLAYLAVQNRLSPTHISALAAVAVVKIALDVANGGLTHAVFTVVILMNAALCFRRWGLVLAGLVVCIGAFASYDFANYLSRAYVGGADQKQLESEPPITPDSVFASVTNMARRSSAALLTSHVVARTPETIPFDDRSPLLDVVANHVPRVIWPDKPQEKLGNNFGRRYGILSKDDTTTSWNVCWAADLYIVGGFYHALSAILLIGVLLGLGAGALSRIRDRAFSFGLFTATLFPLFYQESNLSVMAGSIAWGAAFCAAAYWTAHRILSLQRHVKI